MPALSGFWYRLGLLKAKAGGLGHGFGPGLTRARLTVAK